MSNRVRASTLACITLLLIKASTASAQSCGNETRFRVPATPTVAAVASPTAAVYASGVSIASNVITIEACCPNAGSGSSCKITIAGAPGAPDLPGVAWRLLAAPTSTPASDRCIAAVPSVTPGTDNVLTPAAKEIFRMSPNNNQPPCVAQIEFRATGLQFAAQTAGNTYSRTANFGIVKN